MKTKLVTMLVMLGAMTAFAAPPPGGKGGPGRFADEDGDGIGDRMEARAKLPQAHHANDDPVKF